MTCAAWQELSKDMAAAGWPVVHLIGMFHVRGRPAALRWPLGF
jgi:hypothetical protein